MHERTDAIEEFVTSTLAGLAHCGQDAVTGDRSLLDLGVDSLGIATLATFLEAQYSCSFTPAQLRALYAATCIDDVFVAARQAISSADSGAVATARRG